MFTGTLGKIIQLEHLEDVYIRFFKNLAVNKLFIDKMQSIFSLIAEHSGFIKYTLN